MRLARRPHDNPRRADNGLQVVNCPWRRLPDLVSPVLKRRICPKLMFTSTNSAPLKSGGGG
jgi:hypothetical protein